MVAVYGARIGKRCTVRSGSMYHVVSYWRFSEYPPNHHSRLRLVSTAELRAGWQSPGKACPVGFGEASVTQVLLLIGAGPGFRTRCATACVPLAPRCEMVNVAEVAPTTFGLMAE